MAIATVKAALDAIAAQIANERAQLTKYKARFSVTEAALNNLPAQYAAAIAEINGYTPTGAFETLTKDELAKLTAEFTALKTEVTAAIADLDAYTEF